MGNNTIEEVSILPRSRWGANFGWPYFEGNNQRHGNAPDDVIPPVYEYTHDVGAAVMAGHVYRGDGIPALRGAFVFGDLTGPIWAIGADGVSRLDAERVATLTGWAEGPDGDALRPRFRRRVRIRATVTIGPMSLTPTYSVHAATVGVGRAARRGSSSRCRRTASDEIDEITTLTAGGFGSVRVRVTVGSTSWMTSLFPSTREAAYVLPVKKAVRTAEGLALGAEVAATIELVHHDTGG